jgi:MFS family permease
VNGRHLGGRLDAPGRAWNLRQVNSPPGSSTALLDARSEVDSPTAWRRLGVAVAVSTIGSVGMWSMPVALPYLQADFAIARADASLPYTLTMMGFAFGGVAMGRLFDRFGVMAAILGGTAAFGLGYIAASFVHGLMLFALLHVLIGVGAAATFGPLMADMSRWFVRHRGIAVAIAASGNYVGGAIWPPLLQHVIASEGWRATYFGVGVFCVLATLPLLFGLRRDAPVQPAGSLATPDAQTPSSLGLSPNALMALLSVAGLACCIAMAMPQVHIVAYCGDLGYGVARGAEMLAAMLGFGIISRIASGVIADRIGGAATLLIGSALQGVALFLYLMFDGLVSLYVISALFGLFQGGIVPMYAIIVRQYFPPEEVGIRVGFVLMATLIGMAIGGWMSGVIFDYTGSYRAAFLNGLGWNLLNLLIVLWLVMRPTPRLATA